MHSFKFYMEAATVVAGVITALGTMILALRRPR
jgi:hypothetical protein